MGFIGTKDGTNLFYRDIGKGDPVVLVAGRGMSGEMWNYQVPFLREQGKRVILFDRRGHGRSDEPGYGYDLDTLADDLGTLVERLELHQPTLIGHSLGCAEILRYLARTAGAKIVRRAVLIGPAAPRTTSAPDWPHAPPRAAVEALCKQWRHDFSRWVAENKWPFFVPTTSPALVDWAARLAEQTSLHVSLAITNAMLDIDLRDECQRIDVPVLVIHGDRDASCPVEGGKRVAELVAGARFKLYEGAPHGVFLTHIDRVHDDILEFMQ